MLTKQYPIIHLNDYMYMVDKESHNGEYFIFQSKELQNYMTIDTKMYENYPLYYNEVVATSDKSLNLPLLPKVEEDIEKIADKISTDSYKIRTYPIEKYRDIINQRLGFYEGYIQGHTAASSKKYTEEDMENAFHTGRTSGIMDGSELIGITFKNHLQSLNPKPTSVEVETEPWPNGDGWIHLPKVINNIVQIVKYMYEG